MKTETVVGGVIEAQQLLPAVGTVIGLAGIRRQPVAQGEQPDPQVANRLAIIEPAPGVQAPGLLALLERGTGRKSFVRDEEALEDSWRRQFGYEHPGTKLEESYDLWSLGRDGNAGGEGPDADITNYATQNRDGR